MKSQLFRFYDHNPFNLHAVFWIDGRIISPAVNAVFGSDKWRAYYPDGRVDERKLATGLTIQSFMPTWIAAFERVAWQTKNIGDLVYLDIEHIPRFFGGKWDYQLVTVAAETIRRVAPGLRLCCYGIPTFDLSNAENVIAYAAGKLPQFDEAVKDSVRTHRRLINLLDAVDIGAYLLGAQWVERDLAYIPAMRRIMKRFFPAPKIIYSAWGQFDKGDPTIPQDVLDRYANVLTENGDGVILFDDATPRDDYFVEQLKLRSE